MDLKELGSHARHLTESVISRDWRAVLMELPILQQAVNEVIGGWMDPTPHMMSATPEVNAELGAVADDLADCCQQAKADYQLAGATQPVGAGIDPATILAIIQMAQALAEIIRRIRDRNAA